VRRHVREAPLFLDLVEALRVTRLARAAREAVVTGDRFLIPPAADVDLGEHFLHFVAIDFSSAQQRVELAPRLVEIALSEKLACEKNARLDRGGIERERFAEQAYRFGVRRGLRGRVDLAEERLPKLRDALAGGGRRVGACGEVAVDVVCAARVVLAHRDLPFVHSRHHRLGEAAQRRARGIEPAGADVDRRLGERQHREIGTLPPDLREPPARLGFVSGQDEPPRRLERALDVRRERGVAGARIDEIAVLALRRHRGRDRSGGSTAGDDCDHRQQQKDSSRQFRTSVSASISRSAAANASSRSAASIHCTFRSDRSHVICRFAYARVRRLVSAIAASIVISSRTTAAASLYPIVPNGRALAG
jgi:hypothetical protein